MRRRVFRKTCGMIIMLGLFSIMSFDSVSGMEAIPRKVLVLFDSAAGQSRIENLIYQNAQTVLNYYGLLPEYRDINAKLPADGFMADYRGIITTFVGDIQTSPEEYLSWLIRQHRMGRKIIIMGELGVRMKPRQPTELKDLIRGLYALLGFEFNGEFTTSQPILRYVHKDTEGVEFERKYPIYPQVYEKLTLLNPSARIYVSIRRTDIPESTSSMIFTNPAGGYAHPEFVYWEDPATYRRQWYLNPFLFFKEALAIDRMPAPDPTTLNGLRVAFSHIDGDGFPGLSRIDKKKRCGEIIRDRILKTYAFPVTVSVIVGEVDPKALGSPDLVRLAGEIFNLPNVEPASHSYSHPFYWDPDNQSEAEKYETHGIPIPGYSYDPQIEVAYSMQYITEQLSPPEKPCRVFLWSGNCLPRETDIAQCDTRGYLNMNGGDTLFDRVNNSVTSVAPYYRKVGNRYQIHTGQANENILTNLWNGPHYGYRNIITTMERTERPRRLCPIDIYYHFYSGEYPSSLKALQDVYDWVLQQDIAPVFTSQYIEMVNGYLNAELLKDGDNRYIVRNYGKCLTVRFGSHDRLPDLSRSVNVLGYSVGSQGLYVSLMPGKPEAIVVLSEKGVLPDGKLNPYVRNAGGWVTHFEVKENLIRIAYRGFGNGKLTLAGLPPDRTYALSGSGFNGCAILIKSNDRCELTIECARTGTIEVSW